MDILYHILTQIATYNDRYIVKSASYSESFKSFATYFLFSQKFDFKQSCGYLIKMYSQFSVVKRIFSF